MKKILVLLLMSLLPACDWFSKTEKKASQIITQDRVLESFDELKIAGNFAVTLIKSDHEKAIIKADEQIMPCVATQVESGELNLYMSNETLTLSAPIPVDVYYKNITEIDIAGSVMLQADHLHAPQLTISASGLSEIVAPITTDRLEIEGDGSSKFTFSGIAKKQKMDLSDAVVYNASDLKSTEADLRASGSVRITLSNVKKIIGELSDTASATYKGLAKVEVKSTEDSSITKVD